MFLSGKTAESKQKGPIRVTNCQLSLQAATIKINGTSFPIGTWQVINTSLTYAIILTFDRSGIIKTKQGLKAKQGIILWTRKEEFHTHKAAPLIFHIGLQIYISQEAEVGGKTTSLVQFPVTGHHLLTSELISLTEHLQMLCVQGQNAGDTNSRPWHWKREGRGSWWRRVPVNYSGTAETIPVIGGGGVESAPCIRQPNNTTRKTVEIDAPVSKERKWDSISNNLITPKHHTVTTQSWEFTQKKDESVVFSKQLRYGSYFNGT